MLHMVHNQDVPKQRHTALFIIGCVRIEFHGAAIKFGSGRVKIHFN